MENNDIKLLSNNKSLVSYFNDIVFGNYDDGELHNFLIINENFKNTFFIVSESNDETSLSAFIKNNITSNNIIGKFIDLPNKIEDKNITFSPTNYNIVVLTIEVIQDTIEINTVGLMEWLLSIVLFESKISDITEALKIVQTNEFKLFALNYNDISKDFNQILNDENLQEIIDLDF